MQQGHRVLWFAKSCRTSTNSRSPQVSPPMLQLPLPHPLPKGEEKLRRGMMKRERLLQSVLLKALPKAGPGAEVQSGQGPQLEDLCFTDNASTAVQRQRASKCSLIRGFSFRSCANLRALSFRLSANLTTLNWQDLSISNACLDRLLL